MFRATALAGQLPLSRVHDISTELEIRFKQAAPELFRVLIHLNRGRITAANRAPELSSPKLPETTHTGRGYLYIATATFFWGMSATIGRAAFTGRILLHGHPLGNIDPLILSQSRTTFSCVLLFLAQLSRRGWKQLRVTRNDFGRMALLGVLGLAAANYFYYLAIQKTNVATAITVQYTAPIWCCWYAVTRSSKAYDSEANGGCVVSRWHRRRDWSFQFRRSAPQPDRSNGRYTGGIFLLLLQHQRPQRNGVARPLDSCVLYDSYIVRVLAATESPVEDLLGSLFVRAMVVSRMFCSRFNADSVLLLLCGTENLEPTRAIVASCLEPIFAILIAAVALHETVRPSQALGMLMVLAAIVIVQAPETRGTTLKTQN